MDHESSSSSSSSDTEGVSGPTTASPFGHRSKKIARSPPAGPSVFVKTSGPAAAAKRTENLQAAPVKKPTETDNPVKKTTEEAEVKSRMLASGIKSQIYEKAKKPEDGSVTKKKTASEDTRPKKLTEEADLKAKKLLGNLELKKKAAEDSALAQEDSDEEEERQAPAATEEIDPIDDLRSQVDVLQQLGAKAQKAQNKWTASGTKQLFTAIELMRADIMEIEKKLAYYEGRLAERHDIVQELRQELPGVGAGFRVREQPGEDETGDEGGMSYATVVRRRGKPPPVRRPVILTYPVNDKESSEDTRDFFTKKLQRDNKAVLIHRITKVQHGGIAIEVKDDSQIQKIREVLAGNARYELKDPKRRLPKLMIYDLPSDASEEEIKEGIFEKNFRSKGFSREVFLEMTKLLYRTGPKQGDLCNWVFETSRELRSAMLAEGRLFYGFESLRVVPFQIVTRCFKCQRFGHVSKFCKSDQDICGHSGIAGHDHKGCENLANVPSCSNCVRLRRPAGATKHSANDKECPALKLEKLRIARQNEYE